FASAKTRRRLHSVEFAPGHTNHPVAPESIMEKIRLGAPNEIFLFRMIGRVWLNHETLRQFMSTRTESGAVSIEIEFVCHVIESPHAVALAASDAGFRSLQTCGIRDGQIGPCCKMNFETANGIAVPLDVFATFAMTRFARDPELGHLRIPFVAR